MKVHGIQECYFVYLMEFSSHWYLHTLWSLSSLVVKHSASVWIVGGSTRDIEDLQTAARKLPEGCNPELMYDKEKSKVLVCIIRKQKFVSLTTSSRDLIKRAQTSLFTLQG